MTNQPQREGRPELRTLPKRRAKFLRCSDLDDLHSGTRSRFTSSSRAGTAGTPTTLRAVNDATLPPVSVGNPPATWVFAEIDQPPPVRLYERNWTRLGFFAVLKEMRLSPAVLELDSMIVNIELTLASIVQGVALTFLIENTRSVLSINDAISWLYALSGLCIIFIFWSRSILHTLTLIRWPLEFGHNFLYIACTLAECLLFTCLTNPKAWFELSMIYGIAVWLLFAYDLRMTNVREADPASETSGRLCQLIERDSRLNIRVLMPVLVVFNGLCAACVWRWPAFFIAQHGHLLLIAAQFLGLVIYLWYVVRFASRLAPIVANRQEERRALVATGQTRD